MLKVADIPVSERPRERLFLSGVQALSLSELLQIILERGDRTSSILDISRELLLKFKNLDVLDQAKPEELISIAGLGKAKAARIKAALELGKRFYRFEGSVCSLPVLNSFDAFKLAHPFLKGKKKEHLLMFNLTVRNQLIGAPEVVSIGILDASLIHPREIFGSALRSNAAKIILAHNHPSGQKEPSSEDIAVSGQLVKAGQIMGIELMDHLVIAKSGFASIRSLHPELFEA